MGKKEEGLGRALVKHHNQMVRLSKEKGRQLGRHNRRVLESVTDVADIDAVIEQAEASHLAADSTPVVHNLLVDTDSDSVASEMTPEERRQQQEEEEALHASSLRVPRRPPWNAKMTVEELEENERRAFFSWRRSLARLEENEKLVLTPFEKNLDIWRQLWRVLERSDLVAMVVDARDPLFYRCPDLEAYAQEIDEHKRIMLLVNKADLLSVTLRKKWAEYFRLHGILFLFWSAKAASAALEGRKLSENLWAKQEHESVDSETKIYGRDELLARLQFEAEAIAEKRKIELDLKSRGGSVSSVKESSHFMDGKLSVSKQVTVGFVGYPNVGKSSTINALVGQKRTGVTSTPGKTKHFQTLIISDKLVLCDCPGLVFPSFSSSRYEMVASGVLPIDRMTEHREAVQVVANRVTRHALESIYNITLPKPKPYEPQDRPPLASELLRVYCASRGYVGSSGLPDETRAARLILKDYLDGKLPHFEMPPGMPLEEGNGEMDSIDDDDDDDDDDEQQPADVADEDDDGDQIGECVASVSGVEPLLDDLKLFDNASENGPATAKKKASSARGAAHKQHKKPQRKKDRSWRVQNDNEDGMPVVRVFQKPPVKLDTMVA